MAFTAIAKFAFRLIRDNLRYRRNLRSGHSRGIPDRGAWAHVLAGIDAFGSGSPTTILGDDKLESSPWRALAARVLVNCNQQRSWSRRVIGRNSCACPRMFMAGMDPHYGFRGDDIVRKKFSPTPTRRFFTSPFLIFLTQLLE